MHVIRIKWGGAKEGGARANAIGLEARASAIGLLKTRARGKEQELDQSKG